MNLTNCYREKNGIKSRASDNSAASRLRVVGAADSVLFIRDHVSAERLIVFPGDRLERLFENVAETMSAVAHATPN